MHSADKYKNTDNSYVVSTVPRCDSHTEPDGVRYHTNDSHILSHISHKGKRKYGFMLRSIKSVEPLKL